VRATQPKSPLSEAFVSVLGNTEISVLVANGALASSRWQEKKSPATIKIDKNFDFILLDAGAGCGETFDEALLEGFEGEYFLAGGLSPDNIQKKIIKLHPFAVDVSSGIETEGKKDAAKMRRFVNLVREVTNDRY